MAHPKTKSENWNIISENSACLKENEEAKEEYIQPG